MKKYIITQLYDKFFAFNQEDGRTQDIRCYEDIENPLLGRICVGRIRDIQKNISAAFVEIQKDLICYLSLSDEKHLIFLNPKKDDIPKAGDLILCQVVKEAVKTKYPTVSCYLEMTGRYCVVSNREGGQVGISSKIHSKERSATLRELAEPYVNESIGLILRTACENAGDDDIRREMERLSKQFLELYRNAFHRTLYSVMYEAEPLIFRDLMHENFTEGDEVLTDVPAVYEYLKLWGASFQLKYYSDDYPLSKCYKLESTIKEALSRTVWCDSGAYLVIEPTEALTVIDVNTGKAAGDKSAKEETFYRINLEAAAELARQLRLRNLSGIILVDFINMKDPKHNADLIAALKDFLKKDPVSAHFADMTGLGLCEITRKRERRPLHEILPVKPFP